MVPKYMAAAVEEKEEQEVPMEMVDVVVGTTQTEDVVVLVDVEVIEKLDIEETVVDVAKTIVVDGELAAHKTGHVEIVKVATTPMEDQVVLVE